MPAVLFWENIVVPNERNSQSKFSAKFGIPVRTLQQWEQGISSPPEYLVRMMAYIMLLEENGQIPDEVPIRGKRADGK